MDGLAVSVNLQQLGRCLRAQKLSVPPRLPLPFNSSPSRDITSALKKQSIFSCLHPCWVSLLCQCLGRALPPYLLPHACLRRLISPFIAAEAGHNLKGGSVVQGWGGSRGTLKRRKGPREREWMEVKERTHKDKDGGEGLDEPALWCERLYCK